MQVSTIIYPTEHKINKRNTEWTKQARRNLKNLKKKKGKKVRGKAAFVLPLTQSEMQDVCIKRSHS